MRQRYSFLLSPVWLSWLAVCVVFCFACYLLGQWQLDRRESALEEINRIVANYDQEPVAYAEARELFSQGRPEDEWTVVQIQGEYLWEDSLLARNRGHGGQVGYEQLVPFRESETGDVLVISRGWLPTSSTDGSVPAYNPDPPAGQVDAVVRLKPAEPAIERGAPAGQLASIDLGQYGSEVDYALVEGAYGLMAEESPAAAEAPYQLARPSLDEGPHLGYSMQWVAFGLLSFVGWGYAARVHRRNLDLEELDAAEDAAGDFPTTADLGAADPRLEKQERVRRAKQLHRQQRGRYSDEDAEDAWVEKRLSRSG
ncbi:SURF1 family cytochrome oxidase biogenesis protein [Nesterenkonia alkaliphila]|uniref:SURF1 family cytochrome oxidase biogenesis protein n=1 Tax=Nesterenkonia alkaliphila TaxID=1463631 RepID=UPI0019BA0FE8|nr:SURF1 family protein [Nesterenkonia alkaliphila]GFZ80807.1 SURF1-like protein [Nesterenkonia alkaliphila]